MVWAEVPFAEGLFAVRITPFMHFASWILVLSSSVWEQDKLKDALTGRNSLGLLSWDGTSVFDGVDLIFFSFWFMQVNSFGKNVWQFLIHKIVLLREP